ACTSTLTEGSGLMLLGGGHGALPCPTLIPGLSGSFWCDQGFARIPHSAILPPAANPASNEPPRFSSVGANAVTCALNVHISFGSEGVGAGEGGAEPYSGLNEKSEVVTFAPLSAFAFSASTTLLVFSA